MNDDAREREAFNDNTLVLARRGAYGEAIAAGLNEVVRLLHLGFSPTAIAAKLFRGDGRGLNARLPTGHRVHRVIQSQDGDHPILAKIPHGTLVTACGADRRWLWNWVNVRVRPSIYTEHKRQQYLEADINRLVFTSEPVDCPVCTGESGAKRSATCQARRDTTTTTEGEPT